MIYLIYIVIALEILIAVMGIIAIIKFDKRVNKLNEKIIENRYKINEISKSIRIKAKNIAKIADTFRAKFRKRKNNIIVNFLKSLIIKMGLQILFKKYKKQLLYAALILIAYETIQNSIKA